MQSRIRGILTAGLALGVLGGVAACAPAAPTEPADLTLQVSGLYINWNPFEGGVMGEPPYETLVYINHATGEVVPWLASEFEISDDGRSMEMTLRDDVDFVDGEHLDAAAVETYLEALFASEKFTWRQRIVTDFGTTVTATGDYTLEITTTQPMRRAFFEQFVLIPIASPATIDDPTAFDDGPVGTGPYLLDEFVPEVSVSYVRNPDYRDPDGFDFDTITELVLQDDVAALNALKSGQVQGAFLSLASALEAEASGFTLSTYVGWGTQVQTLFVVDRAGEVQPALADIRVREALNMAFDQETIAETLYLGFGEVRDQPFASFMPEYVEGGDDRYSYDPERARELLAEAGYPDGFAVTIPTATTSMQYADFYYMGAFEPIVQQSLADIGIEVTYESFSDIQQMSDALASGDYPLVMVPLHYTNVVGFVSGYAEADSEVADLITTISEGTTAESAEASKELGELVLDEVRFAPFAVAPSASAYAPEIEYTLGPPTIFAYSLAD
jgi:peptide/nickel transport system substrate-binding protein